MPGIPTLYRGTRFRSRLEARWAAFFDTLNWTWDYEPIDLDGWIPDFALHTGFGGRTLVEVKPIWAPSKSVVAKILRASCDRSENIMLLGVGIGWLRVNGPDGPEWAEYDFRQTHENEWATAGNTVQWRGER